MAKSRGRGALWAAALTGCLAASSSSFAEDPSSALRAALGANLLRITGGTSASPADWPSFARVIVDRGGGSRAYCGGTVIAGHWVATAAHCAKNVSPSAFTIEEGGGYSGGRRLGVDRVEVRPNFNLDAHGAPHDDIALLHLAGVAQSPPQRLLPSDHVASVVVPGAPSHAAGYGLTMPQSTFGPNVGEASTQLLEAQLPIYDRQACASLLADALKAPGESLVNADNLCAGDPRRGGADTCNGDSGGPLTMDVDGARTQVGIVSWGAGCGQQGTVGVYTSVGYFEPWIKQYVPEADFGARVVAAPPPPPYSSSCGLPDAISDRGADVGIVEGDRPRIGSDIHVRVSSRNAGPLVVINVDLGTCKVFRVAPQSYASDPYATGSSPVIIPGAEAPRGLKVGGPMGRNRLYAAILPDRVNIDALVAGGEQSYAAPDVAAIVSALRRQASAFGAYDYRIEE